MNNKTICSTQRRRSLNRSMICNAELPDQFADQIWRDPYSLILAGKKLQEKAMGTVVYLERDGNPFTFKHRLKGNKVRTARHALKRTAGYKAFYYGHLLREVGIATPQPWAFWERCYGPMRLYSYFLSDYVEGTTLYKFLRFENPDPGTLKDIARQVATIRQKLDDLRVCHNDFKTENFLLDPAGKVWLLDLEMTRRYYTTHRLRKRQAREIRDLLHPRNYRANPAAAEFFRQAILKTQAASNLLNSRPETKDTLCSPRGWEDESSQQVTVLVSCQNNADTIVQCLASVRDMADEILVVDCGSTDETINVARQFGGCRIAERAGDEYESLEVARQQAKHPWILHVRANERLGGDLSRDVQDLLSSEPTEDGFAIKQAVPKSNPPTSSSLTADQIDVRLFRSANGQYEKRKGWTTVNLPKEKVGFIASRLYTDDSNDSPKGTRIVPPTAAQ